VPCGGPGDLLNVYALAAVPLFISNLQNNFSTQIKRSNYTYPLGKAQGRISKNHEFILPNLKPFPALVLPLAIPSVRLDV
jgi:hypothetical protein